MTTGTADGSSPSGLSGRLRHGQQHRCIRQGLQTVPTLRYDEQVPVAPTPVGLRRHQAHASLENEDRGFTRVLVLGAGWFRRSVRQQCAATSSLNRR
jgi:hypothetical protein